MTGIGHNKPPRFILIDAKTLDHHIVGWRERGAPATRFEAWFDLLSLASWGDREVKIEGTQIALARGQLVASRRFLSERWGWSEKKVRNFQKRTIDDCMIDIELVKIGGQEKGPTRGPAKGQTGGKVISLLTVCNYSERQDTAFYINEKRAGLGAHARETKGPKEDNNNKQIDSLRTQMWKTGRLLLANGSRSPEKMGGVIGKAIKQTSEGIVFEALMRTQKDNPAEPLSYFNGIIKSATTTKGKPKSFKQQERDLKMEQLRREFN